MIVWKPGAESLNKRWANITTSADRARPTTSIAKTHVGGAINNGCSVEEIKATLLQVAVYCGIPAGVEGIRTAEQELRERGLVE